MTGPSKSRLAWAVARFEAAYAGADRPLVVEAGRELYRAMHKARASSVEAGEFRYVLGPGHLFVEHLIGEDNDDGHRATERAGDRK